MTPGAFDPITAREFVGDASVRLIEAKARTDADADSFQPLPSRLSGWCGELQESMRLIVYRDAYQRRKARSIRLAANQKEANCG